MAVASTARRILRLLIDQIGEVLKLRDDGARKTPSISIPHGKLPGGPPPRRSAHGRSRVDRVLESCRT